MVRNYWRESAKVLDFPLPQANVLLGSVGQLSSAASGQKREHVTATNQNQFLQTCAKSKRWRNDKE